MVKIEDWAVTCSPNDVYTAPECREQRLTGFVLNHPCCHQNEFVRTSPIRRVNGRHVQTESGTLYELGRPSPKYIEWCKENGHYVPTEEQPLRF